MKLILNTKPIITHAQIIAAHGGPAKLARLLSTPDHKVPADTVRAWLKRGIPPKVQIGRPKMMRDGLKLAERMIAHNEWLELYTCIQEDGSCDFARPRPRPSGMPVDKRETRKAIT